MAFESIPFGRTTGQNAMGFQVAFCNAIAFDLADVKRLVYVSGQLAFDEQNELVGVGDVGAQTEQVLEEHPAQPGAAWRHDGGRGPGDGVRQGHEGLRAIHEARLRYFSPPYPTSTLVAVSAFVNPDALIEINAVAAIKSSE